MIITTQMCLKGDNLTFHLSFYFQESSVPVDFNIVVVGILKDKLNLQYGKNDSKCPYYSRVIINPKTNLTSKVCSQPSSLVSSNSPRTTFQFWWIRRVNTERNAPKLVVLHLGRDQCSSLRIHSARRSGSTGH